ncbi:hypothetical protein NC651_032635 [Populus alba x Populus x berolinensis]|nr:hypothetical protein NC651_032635 [Populus alba x Populus x berolinensis]
MQGGVLFYLETSFVSLPEQGISTHVVVFN